MRAHKKDCRGSTMAEVIVAFAVLCIALACFAGVTGLCLRMVKRADDARTKMETRFGYYYGRAVYDLPLDAPLYSGTLEFSDGVSTLSVDAQLQSWRYGDSGSVQFFCAPGKGATG